MNLAPLCNTTCDVTGCPVSSSRFLSSLSPLSEAQIDIRIRADRDREQNGGRIKRLIPFRWTMVTGGGQRQPLSLLSFRSEMLSRCHRERAYTKCEISEYKEWRVWNSESLRLAERISIAGGGERKKGKKRINTPRLSNYQTAIIKSEFAIFTPEFWISVTVRYSWRQEWFLSSSAPHFARNESACVMR